MLHQRPSDRLSRIITKRYGLCQIGVMVYDRDHINMTPGRTRKRPRDVHRNSFKRRTDSGSLHGSLPRGCPGMKGCAWPKCHATSRVQPGQYASRRTWSSVLLRLRWPPVIPLWASSIQIQITICNAPYSAKRIRGARMSVPRWKNGQQT